MKTIKFLLVLAGMTFISCSKEDSETLTGENGGQISRFQLVTVDFGSNTIPSDTYTGTFNNEPITNQQDVNDNPFSDETDDDLPF